MGLRRGEICGLSWGDIDFDRKVADIRHSYDARGNLKATKTKAGTRVLPLSDKTVQILKDHKEAQFKRYARTNQWRKLEEGLHRADRRQPRHHGQLRHPHPAHQPQPLVNRGPRKVRPRRMVPARVPLHLSHPARHPGRAPQGDAGARRAVQLPDLHGHLHAREHGLEEAGRRYRVGSLLAGACGGVRRPLQVRGRFVAVL